MGNEPMRDGLEVLRGELGLGEIMGLIERTACWVDKKTFQQLPVWYPEYARGDLFYKKNWTTAQMNTKGSTGASTHKREGNLYANTALTHALGLRSKERPNWSCCHIWGVDDASYQVSNSIVQDSRYFSCVGNMVLLPAPLKAFTDVMPEVKMMLRVCAYYHYDWVCDAAEVAEVGQQVKDWSDWNDYPESWPRPNRKFEPPGVVPFSDKIKKSMVLRKEKIKNDLQHAGPYYPREAVRAVLGHWKIEI